VFTPPLNIQISKLQETIITNAKFGNMCKFMVFITILGRTFSTRDEWKGNTMQGYWCNTSVTKYFCMRIKACNLCKYKTRGQETFVILHPIIVKVCQPKICSDCKPCWPNFFLPLLPTDYDLFQKA
jgi:hypothetical protein